MSNPNDNQVPLHSNNNPPPLSPPPLPSPPPSESWSTMYDDQVAIHNNNPLPWPVESGRTMYNPNDDLLPPLPPVLESWSMYDNNPPLWPVESGRTVSMYNPGDNQVVRLHNNNPLPPPPLPLPVESWSTMYNDQVALHNNNPPLWPVESGGTMSMHNPNDDQIGRLHNNNPPESRRTMSMYNPNDDQIGRLHNNNPPPPPPLPPVPVESWTKQHDKTFETALVTYPEASLNRWENIAMLFPGRTPYEMRGRYDSLIYDLSEIEAGRAELPQYTDDADADADADEFSRGTPWSEEEHRRFLAGLDKYGKGDWRSISRKLVKTRTSTQVASHAQKYFQRLATPTKERKRSSIHDITSTAVLDRRSKGL